MRAVGIAKRVGRGRGDHRNINVDFAILNRLPASAMRPQDAHAAHLPLRAVIPQWTVHRPFDVMNDSRLHQVNRTFLRRKRRAGKPQEILDADPRRCFQHHQRHSIAIPQVMMVRQHHAIAQPALAQGCLQIRDAFVAAIRVVFARPHRRRSLPPPRLILSHPEVRDRRLAVHHPRHHTPRGVLYHFNAISHREPSRGHYHKSCESSRVYRAAYAGDKLTDAK